MNMSGFWRGCWRHRKAVSLLAAERLSGAEAEAVTAHVERCSRCRRRCVELGELTRLSEGLARALPEIEPSRAFTNRWERAVLAGAPATEQRWCSDSSPAAFRPPLAWAAMTALWVLVVYFRFSAPHMGRRDVPETGPVSWAQMHLLLRAGLAPSTSTSGGAESIRQPAPGLPVPGPRGDRGFLEVQDERRQV